MNRISLTYKNYLLGNLEYKQFTLPWMLHGSEEFGEKYFEDYLTNLFTLKEGFS